MRSTTQWLRERPLVTDAVLVVVLLGLDALTLSTLPAPPSTAGTVLVVLLGPALLGPLVLCRRAPRRAAALVLGALLLHLALEPATTPRLASLSVTVALFALVARGDRRGGLALVAVLVAATAVAVVVREESLGTLVVPVLVVSLGWFVAELAASRRAYDAEVQARLAAAESARDRRAEDAVAAERTRIARELHDVVAHAVSVMVVQADGAALTLERDPGAASRALGTISDTGRQALAELRRTLLLLRGPETGADLTPVPGGEGLDRLVTRVRSVGLPVSLTLQGDVDGLPAGIGLGVHRIVQESLTNVLRHAGPGATAAVTVVRGPESVEVAVTDHGGARPAGHPGAGHGLLGMGERVAVLDGTLDAGPHRSPGAEPGWRVRAVLPLG